MVLLVTTLRSIRELFPMDSFRQAHEHICNLQRWNKAQDRTIFKLKDKCKELSKTVKRQAEASALFMKKVSDILTRGAIAGCSSSDFDFLTPQPQPSIGNGVSYGHPESTDPRHQKTDSEKPRGKDHAGSTTRSHELEESSRSDVGKAMRVIPIFPTRVAEDFVRGVTRVKQHGITHPLARRRSIVKGPTRGG
ncbi:hypothetical protein F2Q69_00035109 [Brassica cretica]|uniref:Uncharacterized protein n=1 Tax=Brassica cretica TaxID=69181 RepID=A0A8S9SKX0_BRACR|nr:hypothetical protein F2Q69_00035109 [Brassica cretica]